MFQTIRQTGVSRENEKMHLFRGAPAVRGWSKYRATVEAWTLCGINRRLAAGPTRQRASCTEDPSLVNCPYCLELMRPAKASCGKASVAGHGR